MMQTWNQLFDNYVDIFFQLLIEHRLGMMLSINNMYLCAVVLIISLQLYMHITVIISLLTTEAYS